MDDLFTEYDQNGDGLISPSEIDSQLDAGIVTINNYVATFDGDNDGKLNPSGKKLKQLFPGRLPC